MQQDRIGVRISPLLRSHIAAFGELSAATQALLILGAVQLGADSGELRQEIGRLLGKRLDRRLHDALLVLFTAGPPAVQSGMRTTVSARLAAEDEECQGADSHGELQSPWDVGFAV